MPESVDREAERISAILDSGEAEYVHLRKPGWNIAIMETLVKSIPMRYHPRIKLHSCFQLMSDYPLGGVHLNSRYPLLPDTVKKLNLHTKVSRSCHTIEEIISADKQGGLEYVTLSPVFSSISKPDYQANALLLHPELRKVFTQLQTPVIALGGVTPDKYSLLTELGYSGAAMLGYAWNHLY